MGRLRSARRVRAPRRAFVIVWVLTLASGVEWAACGGGPTRDAASSTSFNQRFLAHGSLVAHLVEQGTTPPVPATLSLTF